MTFSAGTHLGPYEILAPAGAGGMGEVYKARDTRLDRTVAIKVLPSEFAQNVELRHRLEREARAIASLNHPHICTSTMSEARTGSIFWSWNTSREKLWRPGSRGVRSRFRKRSRSRSRSLMLSTRHDVRRKLLSRLGPPGGGYPAWSPDGRRLALVKDLTRLVVRDIDEESKPELWVTHDSNLTFPSWTPDGRSLLYSKRDRQNYDVVSKSLDGDEKILLGEPFREISPRLTPDGHWLAYQSNENGRFEVFVRAFPSLAHKLQVSTAGAAQPIWSPDGRTLYYLSDESLVAASLAPAPGGGLVLVSSKTLFPVSFAAIGTFGRIYDISPDGKRFLFIVDRAGTASEIRVVLNGLSDPGAR